MLAARQAYGEPPTFKRGQVYRFDSQIYCLTIEAVDELVDRSKNSLLFLRGLPSGCSQGDIAFTPEKKLPGMIVLLRMIAEDDAVESPCPGNPQKHCHLYRVAHEILERTIKVDGRVGHGYMPYVKGTQISE